MIGSIFVSKLSEKNIGLITVLICFLYSVSDEVHQYFVPGRACRLLDVVIDTAGSAFFVLVYHFISKHIKNKSKKSH